MSTTITLTVDRHERDVLRHELGLLPGTFGDLAHGVELGKRYHDLVGRARDGLHLLDDLGWAHRDPRQSFDITLDRGRLAAWLAYQADQAEGCAADNAVTPEEIAHTAQKHVEHGERGPVAELAREMAESFSGAVDEALDLLSVARALSGRLAAS